MEKPADHYLLNAFIIWMLNSAAIMVTANLMPGIVVDNFVSAILAALVLAIAHGVLFPILVVLTLPITILTLGLFLLILNGAMLKITAAFIDGFAVQGWWSAVIGAIILTIIQSLFRWVMKGFGLSR
ncbi:MAG: phage holin family protein [Oligoflexus sp.]